MKKLTYALCVLAALTFFSTSCEEGHKKDPTPTEETPQALIIGEWKSIYNGSDSNSNGIWDSTERAMISDYNAIHEIFKEADSFTSYGDTIALMGTYTFLSDNKRITIPSRLPPYFHLDTVTLDQLNETTLIYHKSDGSYNSYTQFLRIN